MLTDVKILYADDDPAVLHSLANMIQHFGWAGDSACNVTEIIGKVNENVSTGTHAYDAIITAVSFFNTNNDPMLTGITAAKLIRKIRKNVPIIFISTHSNSILREEVRRINESELVTKPLDVMALFNRIGEMIAWHRQAQNAVFGKNDRRHNSINRSDNFRRHTDRAIAVPERLKQVLQEARDERNT